MSPMPQRAFAYAACPRLSTLFSILLSCIWQKGHAFSFWLVIVACMPEGNPYVVLVDGGKSTVGDTNPKKTRRRGFIISHRERWCTLGFIGGRPIVACLVFNERGYVSSEESGRFSHRCRNMVGEERPSAFNVFRVLKYPTCKLYEGYCDLVTRALFFRSLFFSSMIFLSFH